ncbi:6951_t:CDS:2 [Dentiscutata erythropus]|uniref:6951_t:CDS:1 n=1 Tax=Dentiscutata erythropus TaxID=1348616 RepID=A0A9N9A839_9GLOM|nr:6951_t:CDS:2 [Dentiscutata erythropus]
MVYICLCPVCNGKTVDQRTWNNHFDLYMSDDPIPTLLIQENITNTNNELFEICQSNCICEAELKKPVRISKGKILYKAIKTYPYYSIILHLKKILLLPEIEEALESCYKHLLPPNDLLSDVYDAAQKISGFAEHSSKNRCYQCIKKFPTFPTGKVNFSGFSQEFSRLNNIEHKQLSNNWLNANNREKKQIFDKYGIQWTPLQHLPYIDLICFTRYCLEVMSTIYEEITINLVVSTLLKNFPDSINDFILLGDTLAKYLIPIQDILNLYNMSTKISEQNITGAELFPGKFLKPIHFSHLDDITNRYLAHDLELFILEMKNSNSYIVAAFIDEKKTRAGNEYNIYYWPGKVLYYFKHQVQVPKEITNENSRDQIDFETIEHSFAFVDWYKTSTYCDHFYIYNHETDCFQFDEDGHAHAGMFCAKL